MEYAFGFILEFFLSSYLLISNICIYWSLYVTQTYGFVTSCVFCLVFNKLKFLLLIKKKSQNSTVEHKFYWWSLSCTNETRVQLMELGKCWRIWWRYFWSTGKSKLALISYEVQVVDVFSFPVRKLSVHIILRNHKWQVQSKNLKIAVALGKLTVYIIVVGFSICTYLDDREREKGWEEERQFRYYQKQGHCWLMFF